MNALRRLWANLRDKVYSIAHKFLQDEKGSMDQLVWVIGSAVVVVLIIVAFMVLAPDTSKTVWQRFINWATSKFGI